MDAMTHQTRSPPSVNMDNATFMAPQNAHVTSEKHDTVTSTAIVTIPGEVHEAKVQRFFTGKLEPSSIPNKPSQVRRC